MDLQYFPHFIRKNYPEIANESNETLIEIGGKFKKYLENKFKGEMNKLESIWNIDAKTIVLNVVNKTPFLINGYHPALIILFGDYVEEMKKELLTK